MYSYAHSTSSLPRRVILPILHFSDVSALSPAPSSCPTSPSLDQHHHHHRHHDQSDKQDQQQNQQQNSSTQNQTTSNGSASHTTDFSNDIASANISPNAALFASVVARQRALFSTSSPDSLEHNSRAEPRAPNGERGLTRRDRHTDLQHLAFEPDVLPEFDSALGTEGIDDSEEDDFDEDLDVEMECEHERTLEPLLLFGGSALAPSARVLTVLLTNHQLIHFLRTCTELVQYLVTVFCN